MDVSRTVDADAKQRKNISLSEPVIKGNEWKYVKECLDTGWVSSAGNFVKRFEEMFAQYVQMPYSTAVINGTAAIHLALLACDVQPGDEVIVPTLTFIAPVNCVRYCQSSPIFMDCLPNTLCLDVEKTAQFLQANGIKKKDGFTYNRKTDKRIKAIIPVHIFGHPVDMDALMKISKQYNIDIIEDATESLGSTYKGKKTGTLSTVGCFSFNGNKIITAGGGGMVVSSRKDILDKVRHLSTQARTDPTEYDHDMVGYNYRLSNIQAAIGVAQMEVLEKFIATKRQNAKVYRKLLNSLPQVEMLSEGPDVQSNFWFYTLRLPKAQKNSLMSFLLSKKIEVRPIWKLIHTLPMYKNYETYKIEHAVKAYEQCLNIPCGSGLTEDDVHFIVKNIEEYFQG